MRTKIKAVKPKKVLWDYVVEPIIKPTYWDKALPTEERRAKAKRLPVESATVDQAAAEGSSEDGESDNEPICQTLTRTSVASTVENGPPGKTLTRTSASGASTVEKKVLKRKKAMKRKKVL
jgi:hypothetical protein